MRGGKSGRKASKQAGLGAMDYVRAEPNAVLKHSSFVEHFTSEQ